MSQHARPSAVQVAAQAKVNLRLVIVAREASGYHQLETLFLRLALADQVRVRRTAGPWSLDVSGDVDVAAMGPVEKNLAWRAAQAFAAATEMRGGLAIELEKHIPLGGGLGGGSADAGAVLRALNTMSDAPLEPEALLDIAARLGADVPFLTADAPYALAWGRGERMLALVPPEQRPVLLAFPSVSVNTAEAYGWLAEGGAPRLEAIALDVAALSHWASLEALARNDFEWVVARRHPVVDEVLSAWQSAGHRLSMMSGSGSTLFSVARDASPASLPASTPEGVRTLVTSSAVRVEPILPIE